MKEFYSLALAMIATAGVSASLQAADIGLTWKGKSGIAQAHADVIEAKIRSELPGHNVEVQAALGDDFGAVYERMQSEKDFVVVLRSSGMRHVAGNPPKKPTVVAGGNNPQVLGAVDNLESPGGLVTGSTLWIPALVRLEIYSAILPTATNIAFLLEKGHPTSELDKQELPPACEELFLECTLVELESEDEAASFVASEGATYSFIVLNATAKMTEAARQIEFKEGGTPVFGSVVGAARNGAPLAVAPSTEKLATVAGDYLVSIVKGEKTVKELPVFFDPSPTVYVNQAALQATGVALPKQIEELSVAIQ